MKNIEIKLSIDSFGEIINSLKRVEAEFCGRINQVDTYYCCSNGRLKIREIDGGVPNLIFYKRPDQQGQKLSSYHVVEIGQPKEFKKYLEKSFGEQVVVKKKRNLWMYKHTRVHLDEVEGLGTFLELETVLNGIDQLQGEQEYKEIYSLLNLNKYKEYSKSYSDLLIAKNINLISESNCDPMPAFL